MKPNNRAFTLIELLVVVLIIGILASVALPQYQFAVDKSRIMPYVQRVQEISRAQQIYFLSEGEYATSLYSLDIDPTKICPSIAGSTGVNELENCPGGIGIDMGVVGNKSTETVGVIYCQGNLCNYGTRDKHMTLSFKLKDGSFLRCTSYTARGRKLCAFFEEFYQ